MLSSKENLLPTNIENIQDFKALREYLKHLIRYLEAEYTSVYEDLKRIDPAYRLIDNGIDTKKIKNEAITGDKIAVDAVTANKIAAGSITAVKIAANAVEADKIIAGAVTAIKIAANAVEADKIAANAVTAGKIKAGAVETDKIAAGAVTADKITVDNLSAISANLGSIISGMITGAVIRTAASGSRIYIDKDVFVAYDSEDNEIIKFYLTGENAGDMRIGNIRITPHTLENIGYETEGFQIKDTGEIDLKESHGYKMMLKPGGIFIRGKMCMVDHPPSGDDYIRDVVITTTEVTPVIISEDYYNFGAKNGQFIKKAAYANNTPSFPDEVYISYTTNEGAWENEGHIFNEQDSVAAVITTDSQLDASYVRNLIVGKISNPMGNTYFDLIRGKLNIESNDLDDDNKFVIGDPISGAGLLYDKSKGELKIRGDFLAPGTKTWDSKDDFDGVKHQVDIGSVPGKILLSQILESQLLDDFSDGDYTNDPHWWIVGGLGDWDASEYYLKSVGEGIKWIAVNFPEKTFGKWSFRINYDSRTAKYQVHLAAAGEQGNYHLEFDTISTPCKVIFRRYGEIYLGTFNITKDSDWHLVEMVREADYTWKIFYDGDLMIEVVDDVYKALDNFSIVNTGADPYNNWKFDDIYYPSEAEGYYPNGYDRLKWSFGQKVKYTTYSFIAEEVPASPVTNVKVRFRCADTEAGLASADWSAYFDAPSGDMTDVNIFDSIWIEAEIYLETNDADYTPDFDKLELNFMGGVGGLNAETVDELHASTVATAGKLLALDDDAKLPASITGDANTVDGKHANEIIPSGVILMWHGLIANIPTGWALCNGANGTPDLRAKFVRGAPNATEAGGTGGADTHTLATAEIPAHTHGSAGSHQHAATGDHYHTYDQAYVTGAGVGGGGAKCLTEAGNTSTTGNHQHAAEGDHTHSSAGSGTAHENRPAYYQILFIMKL